MDRVHWQLISSAKVNAISWIQYRVVFDSCFFFLGEFFHQSTDLYSKRLVATIGKSVVQTWHDVNFSTNICQLKFTQTFFSRLNFVVYEFPCLTINSLGTKQTKSKSIKSRIRNKNEKINRKHKKFKIKWKVLK